MNVAIAGATGVVGRKIIEILEQRGFFADNFYFFASEKSAGTVLKIFGEKITVEPLNEFNLSSKKIDLAFLACPSRVSEYYAPFLVGCGARVIDNSSAFRLSDGVPLVVPGVNETEISVCIKNGCGIISNPNCSTIMLMPVMNALKKFGLEKMLVTTFQAVSGAGRRGEIDLELKNENGLAFEKRIYSNCLPKIGQFDENGYSEEENKIIRESKKILNMPNLNVCATAVRVPVFNCHSEAVYAEFSSEIELQTVINELSIVPRVKLHLADYPTVLDADGDDFVHAGRIRKDLQDPKCLALWLVSDNLRTGAALNAVLIAEFLQNTSIIDI